MTETMTTTLPAYQYHDLQLTDYHISKTILQMFTLYILSSNKSIRRSHLMNLSTLLNSYDPNGYKSDPEKVEMIEFVKRGLDARLNYNLSEPQLILFHINGSITDDDDVSNYRELSSSDIQWLNQMVSDTINQAHVFHETDRMIDICTRFQLAAPGAEKASLAKEFEAEVNDIQNTFRRSKNESTEDEIFSLQPEIFEERMRESYNELANPSRKLVLGNQALNELFGGGLEETRVYTVLGLPGEGKSMILLDIALMVKKYNKTIKTKDPTKRPCVVVLTMENRITETISRLFNMSIKNNRKMTEFTVEDVMKRMREEGKLVISDDDPIDIIIKFKPAKSVDTSYLYTLVEDLEDMGLECICMIQDYIGRIRSAERLADTRLEYGAIVDEFKIFAALKQIPVVTASQLNRDASKHIDDGRKQNKTDLVRMLGRSNISESILILNNTDGAFVLAPEKDQNGDQWIGIQRIKKRFDATDQDYYYIPCYPNTLTIVEDIGGVPVSKTTMKDENQSTYETNMMSKYNTNPIRNISDFESDDVFVPGAIMDFNGTPAKVYTELEEALVAMSQASLMHYTELKRAHGKNKDGYTMPFIKIPFSRVT